MQLHKKKSDRGCLSPAPGEKKKKKKEKNDKLDMEKIGIPLNAVVLAYHPAHLCTKGNLDANVASICIEG